MAKEFSPTMSEDDIQDYFRNHLPPDLPQEVFENTEGCLRDARLILFELGGEDKGRIMWLDFPEGDLPNQQTIAGGHAFVVPNDGDDDDTAYGSESSRKIVTNGFLREFAEDITEEVLSTPWANL